MGAVVKKEMRNGMLQNLVVNRRIGYMSTVTARFG
jgi:hypothetical protein